MHKMNNNGSLVSEFIILGFSTNPDLETYIFLPFLIIYIGAITGNLIILILSATDPGLNTPMYFFLGQLSFLDICSTSATVPRMLLSYVTGSKGITYNNCVAQLFFITWFISMELLLLTVMAYDRYVAIGNPLRYASIMNHKVCMQAATCVSVTGLFNSLMHTYCTFRVPYCDDNKINHFFCEIMPLLKLACADIYINKLVVYTADVVLGFFPFLLICISYCFIFNTILKIRSAEGKRKAFSICVSHIIAVSLYYGAVISTYGHIQPRETTFLEREKVVSALYAVITPALNPLIYSLRNKDVKKAFMKSFRSKLRPVI